MDISEMISMVGEWARRNGWEPDEFKMLHTFIARGMDTINLRPAVYTREEMEQLTEEVKRLEGVFRLQFLMQQLVLVHSEVSEAVEELRNGHEPNDLYFSQTAVTVNPQSFADELAKPEGVGVELADVIIRIFHICASHGIDLERCLNAKLGYNESRPFRHEGKKA